MGKLSQNNAFIDVKKWSVYDWMWYVIADVYLFNSGKNNFCHKNFETLFAAERDIWVFTILQIEPNELRLNLNETVNSTIPVNIF